MRKDNVFVCCVDFSFAGNDTAGGFRGDDEGVFPIAAAAAPRFGIGNGLDNIDDGGIAFGLENGLLSDDDLAAVVDVIVEVSPALGATRLVSRTTGRVLPISISILPLTMVIGFWFYIVNLHLFLFLRFVVFACV